jgi:CDP-paratose 2-epimerase
MTDNRPILITGGCGFIGCNLADRLAERGDNVLLLDNLARAGVRENAQWLKSKHGDRVVITIADIRDPIPVIDAVRDARAVLHLAAQVAVTDSVSDPASDFEINARGTLNVLEAVRLHNRLAPVIFASTNKVYGRLIETVWLAAFPKTHRSISTAPMAAPRAPRTSTFTITLASSAFVPS